MEQKPNYARFIDVRDEKNTAKRQTLKLWNLYCFSRENRFSCFSPVSWLLPCIKFYFRCYMKRREIRQGVNDEMLRYYVQRKYGIKIGRHSYGYMQFLDAPGKLKTIGNYVSIGCGVRIVGMSHPLQFVSTSPILYSNRFGMRRDSVDVWDFNDRKWDIHIGNDVYIGQYASVFPGVHIGDGAVVGACAVVNKDVKPFSIVAGVPAKEIRKRFPQDKIEALREVGWWNWDDDKVRANLELMFDVDDFLKERAGSKA